MVDYVNRKTGHRKDLSDLNYHERILFDTLCGTASININLASGSNPTYFEFDSKYIPTSTILKINRWAFDYNLQKCFVPAKKMGRKNGISRAYLQNLESIHPNDIVRSFGPNFEKLVKYRLFLETTEYCSALLEHAPIRKEDVNLYEVVVSPEETSVCKTEEQPPSSLMVNIDFSNIVKEDIFVTIHTLSRLGILDDNLRAKLNDKIIESLFETDIVGQVLSSASK